MNTKRTLFSKVLLTIVSLLFVACNGTGEGQVNAQPLSNGGKTLVVYYSYTGNSRDIVNALTSQIDADVLEITPAEKGLHYEANGYELGTKLLNAIKQVPDDAASYPAIDAVTTTPADYSTVIIVTPLWWSQMAALMQTYLFNYGRQMAGKNVGLIVSSASSGIGGVVEDFHRLVPDARYLSKNLWINNSNRSNRSRLIQDWLTDIGYRQLSAISEVQPQASNLNALYDLTGRQLAQKPAKGIYVVNGTKILSETAD